MDKIKYFEDDVNKGIIVDWKRIKKEYAKLGCPEDVYNASLIPYSNISYVMGLSERSIGKTTSFLLLGMLLNRDYGITIQYIRSRETMIQNMQIKDLFKTVRKFHYIEKITNDKYNDVMYKSRRWYYINVDNDGNVIEQAPEHFMMCLSIDKSEVYKSSYNAPVGDFIIFDEFIGKFYPMNEFIYFMDLVKTIIRARISPKIIMLANTIDKHSEYYSEFEIYEQIQMLQYGEKEIITTDLGTKIYVEFIENTKKLEEKRFFNNLFFGFKNPRLASITGGGWATNEYPHIIEGFKTIHRGLYVESHGKLLALDIVLYDDIGICINCHKATRTYEDSIIYSLDEPKDKRYRYYLGQGDRIDRFLVKMVQMHHIRFQNNACGTIFYNFYNMKDARKSGI